LGDWLAGESRFVLPRLHAELSTSRVLAMTYLPSHPIERLAEAPQDARDAAMSALCDLMLREVFAFGVMQTDPNFANYRLDPETGRVVLLDFGATRAIPPALATDLRALLRAGIAQDRAGVSEMLARIGLVPTSVPEQFRTRILDMAMMVFAEVDQPVLDLGTSDLARRLQAEGEALARARFVPPPVPMDLLFVQRKIAGMFLLASRLGARLQIADLLKAHLG